MKPITALKFRHEDQKGVMHYVNFKGDKVGLSIFESRKVEYILKYGKLDVSYDLKSNEFKEVPVKISTDVNYIEEVYNYMKLKDNTYFKDGFNELCVLIFE